MLLCTLSLSLSLSNFLFFCSDINILLVANGANVDWYFHYKSPPKPCSAVSVVSKLSCKFWKHLTPVPQAYIRTLTRWRRHFRLCNSSRTVYQVKPEHRPLEHSRAWDNPDITLFKYPSPTAENNEWTYLDWIYCHLKPDCCEFRIIHKTFSAVHHVA